LVLLTALATIGHVPLARATLEPLVRSRPEQVSLVAIGLMAAWVTLVPVALVAVVARRGWLRWPVLGLATALLLPVFVWLGTDEPAIHHPLPIEEFSPAFAGAEQSHALLMRYAKSSTDAEAVAFRTLQPAATWRADATTRDGAKFRTFVVAQRAAIEADWAALVPQRRWLEELATYERLGDLTPARLDTEILGFQVWRTLSQRLCAIAYLQAIDGRRDEALRTLRPLIHVARRLQSSSRTLVRTMIALVTERMATETALLVLELGEVGPAARAELLAALGAENAPALARRLVLVEYAIFAPVMLHEPIGSVLASQASERSRSLLSLFSPILRNPNASLNLYGELLYRLAALAEKRALGEFAVQTKVFGEGIHRQPGMKNLAGRLMLDLAVPSFEKIVNSHWETADLRQKLRRQLALP
jgi:hypothetical protein